MTGPDFASLTKAQRRALDEIALGLGGNAASSRVLKALVERGLVEERDQRLPGWPPVVVKSYSMPIDVHMRWAALCAAEFEAEAKRRGITVEQLEDEQMRGAR